MAIQIYSNKHCKSGYYEEIINNNNDYGKYLEKRKDKINNDQVKSTLHI